MENAIDPTWTSLLPPLIAISAALISRQIIFSLVLGVFTGALITYNYQPLTAFLQMIEHYIVPALADKDHAAIIIFSMMLSGMIGIISRNGGTLGLVALVEKVAKSARLGQLATWIMGLVIFFDDYANTLIVGNTMRPITDRFKISREKLSYIVDSTAAPVAGLFLSTWVGYEIGVIGDAMKGTGFTGDPFSVFLLSIPYRFYLLLAIVFVLLIALSKRDFGPMLAAERRSYSGKGVMAEGAEPASDLTGTTALQPKEDKPIRWINGALPIFTVIVVTIYGIYHTGHEAIVKASDPVTLRAIVSNANSFTALFWASLSGCTVGIVLSLWQRILTLHEAFDAWFHGAKALLLAMIILILAWSIASVTKELGTAEYIVKVLHGTLPIWTIPALTFVIAAAISFATGTSWGTMAILMPLVVPLLWKMAVSADLDPVATRDTLYLGVSAVLAGAIWGDHCSPISDTTILSSMASSCDHIDHVKTQMPYAIVVGIVSVIALILAARGINVWAILGGSIVVLALLVRFVGRKTH